MAEDKRGHCPTCDGERACQVHGTTQTKWIHTLDDANSTEGGTTHTLLQCRGCETVFYEMISWNSDDFDAWNDAFGKTCFIYQETKKTYPTPASKTKPLWLDQIYGIDAQLFLILNEMYAAYDHGSYILTSIGLRTALDRGTEVLGIDPAITFAEKLKALKDTGSIGEVEKDILDVVTDAGNAAAHRSWSPKAEEVAQLITVMEVFLQKAFIVGKKVLGIKANIPPKPIRKP